MENQHKLITGYRDLTQQEIDLMNKVKAKGEEVRALLNEVRAYIDQKHMAILDQLIIGADSSDQPGQVKDWVKASPIAWLDDAYEEISTGFMKLVRSIAQPTTF